MQQEQALQAAVAAWSAEANAEAAAEAALAAATGPGAAGPTAESLESMRPNDVSLGGNHEAASLGADDAGMASPAAQPERPQDAAREDGGGAGDGRGAGAAGPLGPGTAGAAEDAASGGCRAVAPLPAWADEHPLRAAEEAVAAADATLVAARAGLLDAVACVLVHGTKRCNHLRSRNTRLCGSGKSFDPS